jgi:hypothetical protein
MANIKQLIPAEKGWEGVIVRDDATFDSAVKTSAAPLVGWALIDDENGESSVHAVLNMGGATANAFDLGAQFLGTTRAGGWAERLDEHWEGLAVAFMEEFGEPGAATGEEGEGEGEGGEGEAAAPEGEAKPG